MLYSIVADVVVLVHLGFILFVATGALLAYRWPVLVWGHLPALGWSAASLTVGLPCPLTAIEKTMRRWSGAGAYEGGFVDHYLEGALYPAGHSSALQAVAATMIVAGYAWCRRSGGATYRAPSRLPAEARGRGYDERAERPDTPDGPPAQQQQGRCPHPDGVVHYLTTRMGSFPWSQG